MKPKGKAYSSLYEQNGRIYYRYRESGKSKAKATGCKATTEGWNKAREWKEKFLFEQRYKRKHTYLPLTAAMLFSEAYTHIRALTEKHLSENTKQLNDRVADLLIGNVGDLPLYQLTRQTLERFNEMLTKYSLSSQSIYTRHLQTIFSQFVKCEMISKNPVTVVKQPSLPVKVIPQKDLSAVLKELTGSRKHAAMFLLYSGFRLSDLCALKWEDVNIERGVIFLWNVKAGRREHFPILAPLKELLKKLPHTGAYVLPYRSKDSFRFWNRVQVKLWGKTRYTLHQLRKTFISKVVNSGMSLYDVQILARHKDIRTTLKYYTEAEMRRIADEADKKVQF